MTVVVSAICAEELPGAGGIMRPVVADNLGHSTQLAV
jgi:hypothetical protein